MIPVLFKGNETNFNHNGIGLLKDTLSCEVSEVRNGSFDLELVYPITGPYFKDLKNGNIIQAKPNDTDQPHNFRITEIDKTLSDKEVVVYGVSITNDLGGNMVKSLYLADVTPQVILNEMKNVLHYPTPFNFVSNITTVGSVDWELNNPLNLIVGEEGSLVDIFGGEVKRTNDTLFLYGRRGKDNVTTIRAGKNLDGFKMTESFQGKYTQILPYFKYEAEIPGEMAGDTEGETIRKEVTVFGSIVSSPYHGRYPVNAIKPIDFSQNEVVRESKSLESLNSVASKYFSNLYSEIDKPSVSINVDMVQLVDSEQYELYERLEKVELTDTVSVYVPEYDVDILVKINELKYDSLRERTISIVASSSSSGRTSLMDEISGSYKQFTTKLVDDKLQSATSGIINQILTQKNGSNMYAGRATPPDTSKPGDIWFKDTGGGDVELYEFDGVNWVRKMYKGFGDDVRQLVDDKIAESNTLFTGAIEDQAADVEQVNALAQLAKTEAANASISASRANQEAQQAKTDAANAKAEALAKVSIVGQALETAKTNLQNQVSTADSKAVKAQADVDGLKVKADTIKNDLDTAKTNLQNQVSTADSKAVKAQADVDGLKVKADTIKNDLDTAKTNLQNQVSTADSKAVKAQADANALRTDLNQQAQTLLSQAQAQTALTNRVSTVETLADGTRSTVAELSKTVSKATGDITSVTSRTKTVEDTLSQTRTQYEDLTQTVNTQTGQIDSINRKTADLQSGIDGVTERFENLQVGGENIVDRTGEPFVMGYGITNTTWNPETKRTRLTFGTGVKRAKYNEILPQGSIFESQNVIIKQNQTYTQAIRVATDATFLGEGNLSFTWYGPEVVSGTNGHRLYKTSIRKIGVNEYLIWSTVTWDRPDIYLRPFDIYNLHTSLDFRNTGTFLEFYEPKLETGSLPTDWCESNTDFNNQIAEYKRTVDQNYAGLQSTVSTLDGKVTQNKSEQVQTADAIKSRLNSLETYKDAEGTRVQAYFEASKTETAKQITAERTAISANYVAKSTYEENVRGTTLKLNEIKTTTDGKVTTAETKINQLIGDVSSKVSKTDFNTLNGRVTNAESNISQQADQIALKANQTELNNLTGRVSTAESSITQVPNKITLAVEQVTAKIPTSAGTKNYLSVSKVGNRGSNNFSYNASTGIWSMTVPVNSDGFGRGIYFDTRGNTVMLNGGETLFIGLTVMVDKTVGFNFDINNRLHVNHMWSNDNDDRSKSVMFPTNKVLEPNVWTRVYLMYTAKPGVPIWDDDTNFGLLNSVSDVYLQIKEVTMAKSNIPVDYQKAEADIDNSIKTIQTNLTLANDKIELKAEKTELNNLNGKVTQNKSEQVQTADAIKSRLNSLETYKDAEGTRVQAYFEASKTETAKQITAERTAISANYVAKSTYEENVRGTTLKLNEIKTTTDGKVTTAETKINQLIGDVSSKVSKTDFNTLNGRVTNAESNISQQADQIALKANQTELNNLTGRVSTAESSITQVPNKITLAVEQVTAKIPTSAGTKNYLSVSKVGNRGSNNFSYNASTGIWSMTVPVNSDGFGRGIYFDTRGNTVMLNGGETLFIGLTVMVDKTVGFNFDINNRLHVNHMWSNDNDDRSKSVMFPTNKVLEPNVWTRVYLMYTAKPGVPIWDDDTNFGLLNSVSDVYLQIKEVTMAKSNIPVDYQKAEADIDNSIKTIQTNLTLANDKIELKAEKTELNNLTGRVSTAESSITQVPNKITLAVEQVTAKIPTSAGTKNYLSVSKVGNRGSNNFSYNASTGIWSMTVPVNSDGFGRGIYFDTRGNTVMLNGGETLFIGLTVMVDKTVGFNFDINNRLHVNHMWSNDNDDRSKSVMFPTNKVLEPNVWTRVYLMYTAKPGVPIWDDDTNFGLLNSVSDVYLQIKEVTMAKSNIPVDYQKAEADIDNSIKTIQTNLTLANDKIELKAEKTELNNLTGRVSTAEGNITTQAGLIELKAAKTDLIPITNSLNTKVDINQVNAAITVGTSGIRQEVSSVKGVLEGGISARNYAVGTGTPSTHSVDSRIETASIGYVVKQVYSTYKNKTLRDLGFKVGDKYTVIFDIYAENNTSFKDYRVEGYHSSYSHLIGSITNTIGTSSNPTQFVGSFTITADSHLTAYRWFIRFDLSYFKVTVKNFRIFKGEIKQDWYPAWEDQEAALESTKSRVDITEKSITSLVTGDKTLPDGRKSVFATKIESLEGVINQRVTTQELNNRGYQTSTDVTNTINNRTDLARKNDIPTELGGRNLAQKTSSDWSTPYTSFSGSVNTCPQLYKVLVDDLAVGDTLKSRIVLKYTDIVPASGRTVRIWLQGDGNVTGWNAGRYPDSIYKPISGSGAMVFEHEFKITADHLKNEYWNWMFRTDYIASGSLQWKLAKVEKGPLWTAWSPAPEDAEAALTDKLAGYVTNQTYTTYTTNRQQTDTQITEQINQTVSKVPTGPVNLIVNGFDPQTIEPWTFGYTGHTLSLTTHEFFYRAQKKLYKLYTSNTNEGFAWTNIFNLKRDTKYTLRVGLFANWYVDSCDIHFMGKSESNKGGDFSYRHLRRISDLSPSKVVYYTITFDSGSFDLGQFRIDNNGSKIQGTIAMLFICEVSCIEGEYNNSWTPSYDELITEQKFNETKATVDSFSRAIGTRDENGFVPNIARLVMTQDSVISEVAKYGEHNSNLVQDSVRFSTTREVNGSGPTVIADGHITWRKYGATTNTWAGIGIPVNIKRFIAGEKYTLSFEYYLYNSPDADIGVEIKDHTNNITYFYGFIANASTPIKTYRYFQQTFTISIGTASNTIVQDLYFRLTKNGDIGIKNVMFVRGEKIGPYSTSQVDIVATRVEQTANSYSIKFLNNANDITTQLNLTNSATRIKSSLIHLDGDVTVSGTSWMDGAVIKNISADKVTTGTLDAEKVRITNLSVNTVSGIDSTFLKTVIGDAFIGWMKGKIIQGYNKNMTIDLLGGNITLNSGSNAIKRVKGTHTAFVHFNDVSGSTDGNVGSLYAAIGVTSSGDGVNSMSEGRFSGLRAFRAASGTEHATTIDQTEIYGDAILFRHGFTSTQGFRVRPTLLDKQYDLNDDILNPIRFFARLLIHLNNTGWNWQNRNLINNLSNEWNQYGLSRYGGWTNGNINIP